MEVVKTIKELLDKPIEELGYEIAKVNLKSSKTGLTLEISIDRDDPISLDDIVIVSEKINEILDEADPIEAAYTLDVSSLGAEKPIKIEKLNHYIGKYVNVHIINPIAGKNVIEGDLIESNDEKTIISYREKTRVKKVEIPTKDIDKARLAIKF